MTIKTRLYQLFPYISFLIFITFLLVRILIVNSKSMDIAGIEQNVVYSTQMFMDSDSLYQSPGKAPFSITQYTPLYYYLCGITAKVSGISTDNIHALYVIGRSWNVLFNLITALLVFTIGKSVLKLSSNKSYFLFILSFSVLFTHNFAVRSDSMTDMFGMASIYIFMQYYRDKEKVKSTLLLLLTVLLSALALFSKQSGIQLIIIFAGFSFLMRDWKTLVKLVIATIVIYGGFLVLFNHLYSSFFLNVVGGIANGINLTNFFKVLRHNIVLAAVWPLIIISATILLRDNTIFKGTVYEKLLATCTLGTLVFALITALKMGSTAQYFTLFINLSLLLAMNKLQYRIKTPDSGPFFRNINTIFYAYLLVIISLCGAYALKTLYANSYEKELSMQRESANQVAAYIRLDHHTDTPFYIFSNLTTDSTLPSRQTLNNIFYKGALVPQMDILEYSTGPSKVIGYENLEEMLRQGKVEYIVESQPKSAFILLKNLEQIKKSRFSLVKEIDGYLIYKLLPNQ